MNYLFIYFIEDSDVGHHKVMTIFNLTLIFSNPEVMEYLGRILWASS